MVDVDNDGLKDVYICSSDYPGDHGWLFHQKPDHKFEDATKPSALLESNLNLSEVLGDGPKQSGGHRDEIVAAAGIATDLEQLAESLKRQYLIEYALPDGVKPSDKISVSVKRSGITLWAPTRIPDK